MLNENKNRERVVVTGMGVVASNAHGLDAFASALRDGVSGVAADPSLLSYKFGCQVSAKPKNLDLLFSRYFDDYQLGQMNECISLGAVAAIDAMRDANLLSDQIAESDVDPLMGAVIGTGIGYLDYFGFEVCPRVVKGEVRRLGSATAGRSMISAISAHIGGLLGLGGPIVTTSCACATGTDAVVLAAEKIRLGIADRMLAGAAEAGGAMSWSGLESLKVLSHKYNDRPQLASRPMSASSSGLVPGSGAAMLVLESLSSALGRGAPIYAELLGGATTSGGMRRGGTMTAPSSEGVVRCIRLALRESQIDPRDVDYINGHLTGTMADGQELPNWSKALGSSIEEFPKINSTKSLLGHTLGASGAIEAVATILQLRDRFIHPSVNCEDLRPELALYAPSIVGELISDIDMTTAISASFGFGDVNSCLILRKWSDYE